MDDVATINRIMRVSQCLLFLGALFVIPSVTVNFQGIMSQVFLTIGGTLMILSILGILVAAGIAVHAVFGDDEW